MSKCRSPRALPTWAHSSNEEKQHSAAAAAAASVSITGTLVQVDRDKGVSPSLFENPSPWEGKKKKIAPSICRASFNAPSFLSSGRLISRGADASIGSKHLSYQSRPVVDSVPRPPLSSSWYFNRKKSRRNG